MLLNDEVQLLRKVSYFSRVDPCKLKLLAFTSERVCYNPGEEIFRQGDISDSAYVILRGNADILVNSGDSKIKIGDASPNSIIGEMCLLCDAPRAISAQAVSEVEALRINKDCFFKVISDNPRISFEISRALAETLRGTTARVDTIPSRQPIEVG